MGRSTTVLALGAALAVTSCAKTYHVDDTSGQSLILSARDRVILTKKGQGISQDAVCAEPSPDVAVGTNVTVALNGSVSGVPQASIASGSGSGTVNVVESLMALGARTSGVQVLRDVGYRACEAYMNGAIDREGYRRILRGTGTTITALVAVEALRGVNGSTAADRIKDVVQLVVNDSHNGQETAAAEQIAAKSGGAE
jgi:hypothetical protein